MSEKISSLPQYRNELLSDEVQEVISYRPHWIVRKGNSFFFIIIFSLLALTWVIKYPDVINGSAKLVALNPPKLINSKVQGKLVKLFVTNEQGVQKDQPLGYMESTALYDEVMQLRQWIEQTINKIKDNNYETIIINPLPLLIKLGDLQSGYQQFQNELILTKETLSNGYFRKKKNSLEKDLQYLSNLKNNTYEQKKLLEQDKELQNAEYKAYEQLAKEKVIAPLELNQYKSKMITKDQGLKQINTQITNNEISSHSKQKELLDLQKAVEEQQQKFRSALFDLKNEIEKWIQQYVLIASEDGKVLFTSSLQENELISNGQSLFYIEPPQTKFYAELMAGQKGLGKIKSGQKVMLKVESYPSNEFGYLTGIVSHISNLANRRDSFLVKVDLQKGLETNYNKTLFFRNDMLAQAEIITDNRKLFDRLAGNLKKVWER